MSRWVPSQRRTALSIRIDSGRRAHPMIHAGPILGALPPQDNAVLVAPAPELEGSRAAGRATGALPAIRPRRGQAPERSARRPLPLERPLPATVRATGPGCGWG